MMPRLVVLVLLSAAVLFALSCVPAEPDATEPVETATTPSTGLTPVVPSTRALQTPTASTTTTPPPQSVTGCSDARPAGLPTVVSSQGVAPSAPSTPGAAAPSGERLSSPVGVQSPGPVPVAPMTPDFALEGELRQILGDDADGYAVVAMDLETGRGVSINGEQVFYSASLFKLWVMYEVFHQHSLGHFALEDRLVVTPYYDGFGLGPRATELCGAYTIDELLQAMVSISDNSAAVLLQDLVGAPNINTSLEALGLKASAMTTEDLTITAEDTALLLQIMAAGNAVDRQASEAMASLLLTETFDNGLAAGLPPGTRVGHKTGNWSNARHDAGIVFAEETTYLVVILSDNRDGSYDTTKLLSAALYEAFTTP